MVKTLLLYDGKMSSAERVATNLSYLIGNAKVADMADIPASLDAYQGFCLVFNFYGAVTAGRITAFLSAHQEMLRGRRIALVGIGFADTGFMNYVVNTERSTGIRGIEGYFLARESQTDRIGTEIAKMMHTPEKPMDEEALFDVIDNFIKEHKTLALSTAEGDYIRSTPLDYIYMDGIFYIITEGGSKFRGIMDNGRASASIFDPHTHKDDPIRGLQIQAEAKIIPVGSDEYQVIMTANKLTADKLAALPVTLFLIKLIPLRFDLTDETLIAQGFDAGQTMNTTFRKETWQAGAVYAEAAAKAAEEKAAKRQQNLQKLADVTKQEAEEDGEDERDFDGEMTAREARRIIEAVTPQTEETVEEAKDDEEEDDFDLSLLDEDSETDFDEEDDTLNEAEENDEDFAEDEALDEDDDRFDFEDEIE